MCIVFYALAIAELFLILYVMTGPLKRRLGTPFSLLWFAVGIILYYNVMYNHFHAMVVKPGSPKDLKKTEAYRSEAKEGRQGRQEVKDADNDDRFEGLTSEVKRLVRYRSKTVAQLEKVWERTCDKCKEVKPARTHHCSMCNSCVLIMDHHCPLVNNCIGLENKRYFLLFVFYLWVGLLWINISIVAMWNFHQYRQHQTPMRVMLFVDTVVWNMLTAFNGWNWFLAFRGETTLEFLTQMKGAQINPLV